MHSDMLQSKVQTLLKWAATFYLVVYNVKPKKWVETDVWLWHDRTLHVYLPKKLELLLWPCVIFIVRPNTHGIMDIMATIYKFSQIMYLGLPCSTKHIFAHMSSQCQPGDIGEHASMSTNKSCKNNLASLCLTIRGRVTAAVAEWLGRRTPWSCWRYGEREVVSSIPGRGNIVGWVFHPSRWLERFSLIWICLSFQILNLFRKLSSWGSINYKPSALLL